MIYGYLMTFMFYACSACLTTVSLPHYNMPGVAGIDYTACTVPSLARSSK